MKLHDLKRGDHGDLVLALQHSVKARARARGLHGAASIDADGDLGPHTLHAVSRVAWALGARGEVYKAVAKSGVVPVDVFRLIRNPGKRNQYQVQRGKARMSHLRVLRKRQREQAAKASSKRLIVVRNCLHAAADYARNPGAYHYLAGGTANLIYLKPSPLSFRSDCSQFASSVQHDSGLPDLGPNGPLWVNTVIMAAHLEQTHDPQPADFGMYGSRSLPHHVEVYLGAAGGPGREFVGHGSPPIDSLTPGRPDYYLRNPVG